MKNVLRSILYAGIALACVAPMAHAQKRVEKELGWRVANSAVANGDQIVLTVARPLASEAVDTTGTFSLVDADFIGGRNGGRVANFVSQDSILIGYISLYSDSTADGASTCTAVTATIEASGDGQDWATVQTVAQAAASDDPVIALPIWLRPGLSQQASLITAPILRIRFTTVTGILVAARCKLIYWANDRIR